MWVKTIGLKYHPGLVPLGQGDWDRSSIPPPLLGCSWPMGKLLACGTEPVFLPGVYHLPRPPVPLLHLISINNIYRKIPRAAGSVKSFLPRILFNSHHYPINQVILLISLSGGRTKAERSAIICQRSSVKDGRTGIPLKFSLIPKTQLLATLLYCSAVS